jgi:DNA-binding CsgD family transcriptional regulator
MFADHAAALAAHDDEAMAGVAERFADIGALGLASQTMAAAAETAADAGRLSRARRWRTRWHELAAGCDAPISLAPTIAAEPLTAREHEIALMVVEGGTSRQIADRFGLSVRTVDNHLAHVFTKLGISSRADLRRALTNGGRDVRSGQPSQSS